MAENPRHHRQPRHPIHAPRGQRTITVALHFSTDRLAEGDGMILPRHAWPSGKAYVRANQSHGITAQQPVQFDALNELPTVVTQVLQQAGVTLHQE